MDYSHIEDNKIVVGNIAFSGMCKKCWRKVLEPTERKNKMKLFISQPMRDKTDEQIKQERTKAIHWVEANVPIMNGEEIEVLDSFFEGAPAKATPLWYLGESIKLLGAADIVYFCKDWEKYNGCTIEHECAVRYGKKCIYA